MDGLTIIRHQVNRKSQNYNLYSLANEKKTNPAIYGVVNVKGARILRIKKFQTVAKIATDMPASSQIAVVISLFIASRRFIDYCIVTVTQRAIAFYVQSYAYLKINIKMITIGSLHIMWVSQEVHKWSSRLSRPINLSSSRRFCESFLIRLVINCRRWRQHQLNNTIVKEIE